MNLDFLKSKVFEFNGLQVTVGALVLIVVVGYLVYRAK